MITIHSLSHLTYEGEDYPGVLELLDAKPSSREELRVSLRAYDGASHSLRLAAPPPSEGWANFRMRLISSPVVNGVLASLRAKGALALADALVPAAMLEDTNQLKAAWNAAIAMVGPVSPLDLNAAAQAARLPLEFKDNGSIV